MKLIGIVCAFLICTNLLAQQENKGQDSRIFYNIEEALQTPKAVFKLYIEHDNLKQLPERITEFKELRELQLGGNPDLDWTLVFELLVQLPQLEKLSLSENKMTALPKSITQLMKLKILTLVDNPNLDWEKTFEYLKALPNLEVLDIGNNKIKDLPSNLSLIHI